MKYCIIHVNDRAKENMDYNRSILKDFSYIDDIEFFNGNEGNAFDVLNHAKIPLNVWSPYDGRNTDPLPGEYGIWVSTINLWQYIIKNKIDKMLVLEDDVLLKENFLNNFYKYVKDLPEDFDFLSLYYFQEQNEKSNETEIGSKLIQKSNKQYSAAQAMLYSYSGAKKLLKLVHRKGIEYTNDCFIYRQALEGLVNGYSIKGPQNLFLTHTYKDVKSLIDPNNFRSTDTL